MRRSNLRTLLRLRKMAVDAAQSRFATVLDQTLAAGEHVRDAEGVIVDEMAAASRIDASDTVVEAFAAWLPRGRAAVAQARARLDRAEAELVTARARLDTARSDLKLVETLLEQQDAAARAEEDRQSQYQLDELGSRQRAPFAD
jgi:flagellar export protein FliJ